MSNKIPTAKDFLSSYIRENNHTGTLQEACWEAMRRYTKLHVEAALEAAAENAKAKENPDDYGTGEIWVDKQSILNAYPEDKII